MSRSNSQPSHFLRRLILLLLLVVAVSLGLVLLTRSKTELPSLMLDILTDIGLGLIAGVAVRLLFANRSGFIRGLAAAAAVVIGLGVIGYFTDWKMGIGPLKFGRSEVDLLSLAHLVVAIDMSWIALRLGRQHGPRVVEVSPRSSGGSTWQPSHDSHSHTDMPLVTRANVPVYGGTRSSGRAALTGIRPAVRGRTKMKTAANMPVRPRRKGFFRQSPQVQLALVEDHRCPYCLDPVKRNDPRGVRECDICHALHHADCWAITGTCQVPHLN